MVWSHSVSSREASILRDFYKMLARQLAKPSVLYNALFWFYGHIQCKNVLGVPVWPHGGTAEHVTVELMFTKENWVHFHRRLWCESRRCGWHGATIVDATTKSLLWKMPRLAYLFSRCVFSFEPWLFLPGVLYSEDVCVCVCVCPPAETEWICHCLYSTYFSSHGFTNRKWIKNPKHSA